MAPEKFQQIRGLIKSKSPYRSIKLIVSSFKGSVLFLLSQLREERKKAPLSVETGKYLVSSTSLHFVISSLQIVVDLSCK